MSKGGPIYPPRPYLAAERLFPGYLSPQAFALPRGVLQIVQPCFNLKSC